MEQRKPPHLPTINPHDFQPKSIFFANALNYSLNEAQLWIDNLTKPLAHDSEKHRSETYIVFHYLRALCEARERAGIR